jgi:hypothetical protein
VDGEVLSTGAGSAAVGFEDPGAAGACLTFFAGRGFLLSVRYIEKCYCCCWRII